MKKEDNFNKKNNLQFNFFIAFFLSIIIIFADSKIKILHLFWFYTNEIFSPIYHTHYKLIKNINNTFIEFIDKKTLNVQNKYLRQQILLKEIDLLELEYLKKENINFRKLLNLQLLKSKNKVIAKIIFFGKNFYKDQIIIDKGINHGVYQGQILIFKKSIIGQVVSVNKFNSKALLICSVHHILPVQIKRNNIRFIASGIGCANSSNSKYLLNINYKNIKVGDYIFTTGLIGEYTVEYPLGIVRSIINKYKNNTIIEISNNIDFKQLSHVILLKEK